MSPELSPIELRLLGSLVEKELATPDYYPLTLSALQNACNQKTNRDPVSRYSEDELRGSVEGLIAQSLVRERNPAGSRVAKYAHRLSDSLGLSFGFTRYELGVLAVLMLRGPQTPGELRSRTERLREPGTGPEVDAVLEALATHERGPWVQRLAKEPGRREARWQQLLGGDQEAQTVRLDPQRSGPEETRPPPPEAHPPTNDAPSALALQISQLAETVLELELRLEALETRLDAEAQ